MTQEDKELLLKDLCARLPYGVKCENFSNTYGRNVFKVTDIRDNGYICGIIDGQYGSSVFEPLELKPYLFPLSSMTEEQKNEYYNLCIEEEREKREFGEWVTKVYYHNTIESIDWLNKNHFDYRGLIEKGLAINATRLNIY